MISNFKFDVEFSQNKLIKYIDGLNGKGFKDKITQAYNVTAAESGLCYGLSNLILRCSHSGLQKDLINQLNESINIIMLPAISGDSIDFYYDKSLREHYRVLLNNLSLPILNTRTNHDVIALINNIIFYMDFTPPIIGESDIKYINRKLADVKAEGDVKVHLDSLSEIIGCIHTKLMGNNINDNNKYISIARKILKSKCMDRVMKIKEFMWNAFEYYSESLILNMNLLNNISGLSTYENYSKDEMVNLGIHEITLSDLRLKLEKHESFCIKEPLYLSIASVEHTMALVVNYDAINKCYSYEFFDPNKGMIKYNDFSSFMDFFSTYDQELKFRRVDGEESNFRIRFENYMPIRENNKKINIRKVDDNDVFTTTKKYLSEDKVEIKLLDEWKLKFDDYNVEKNKIK